MESAGIQEGKGVQTGTLGGEGVRAFALTPIWEQEVGGSNPLAPTNHFNTMGTGTTSVTAAQCGRNSLGIEVDPVY